MNASEDAQILGSRGSASTPLAGFVSTSVLTSSDGLFGDNSEEKRIVNAPVTAIGVSDGVYKPLYERLQEQQAQKDSKWMAARNPFAPPKALDAEEFTFIENLESKRIELEKKRKCQQEQDRAAFLLAKSSRKQQNGILRTKNPSQTWNQSKPSQKSVYSIVISGKRSNPSCNETNSVKKQKVDRAQESTNIETISGLVEYGSESD